MKYIAAALALMIAVLPARSAFAHVLIMDTTHTRGAIVHIMPDDDPEAGVESQIYFDIQNKSQSTVQRVRMSVHSEQSKDTTNIDTVEGMVDGPLVMFHYTFPSQGVYTLTFGATIDGKTYIFELVQRVSRGVSVGSVEAENNTWAEGALTASGVGFLVLGIIAFNRRKEILQQST